MNSHEPQGMSDPNSLGGSWLRRAKIDWLQRFCHHNTSEVTNEVPILQESGKITNYDCDLIGSAKAICFIAHFFS